MTETEKIIIKNICQSFIEICDKHGTWESFKDAYFDAKQWLIKHHQERKINQLYRIVDIYDESIHYGFIVREDVKYIFVKKFNSNNKNEVFIEGNLSRFRIKNIRLKEVTLC